MSRAATPIKVILETKKPHRSNEVIQKRMKNEERLRVNSDKLTPPSWLKGYGRKIFKQCVDELRPLDIMTNLDVHSLAVFADAVEQYKVATEDIRANGQLIEYTNSAGATNVNPNPSVMIANKYADMIKKFGNEFGLTPQARAKLAIHLDTDDDDEVSDFEDSFGGVV